MTKLSSGFRINRAADDAAGLGIANDHDTGRDEASRVILGVPQCGQILWMRS